MAKSPRSPDLLGSAFMHLENQFPVPFTPPKSNDKSEQPLEHINNSKFNEYTNLNNNIKQNEQIVDEEKIIATNFDASGYKNEPFREKFLGIHWKRRLPAALLPDRKICVGIPDEHVPNNKIFTSKYNVLTFLPMNLFEQFSKLANIYFLLIAILQVIPDISNTDGQPLQLIPLSFILAVSMVKDAFEDYKRHKADYEENNKDTLVYRNSQFQKAKWKDLLIGDIIKVL